MGTRVPSWASAAGGQHVKGAQHLEQVRLAAARLQSRAERYWAEKSPEVSVTGTQLQSYKKYISGHLFEKNELVGSMCHHHSTCCPEGDSPMSVREDSTAAPLLTDRDNSLGSYFLDKKNLMQCIFLFSCHHLSVALLNTSTIHSRISSQTSPCQMLHIRSRWLTDCILKKHIPFFR